jgi:hypothetical protein
VKEFKMAAKRKSPTKPMEAVEAQVNQLLNAVESFYQAAHNGDYKKMRKARDARNVLALSLEKDYKIRTRYHSDAAYEQDQSKAKG